MESLLVTYCTSDVTPVILRIFYPQQTQETYYYLYLTSEEAEVQSIVIIRGHVISDWPDQISWGVKAPVPLAPAQHQAASPAATQALIWG